MAISPLAEIHPSAVVSDKATIGDYVKVGPFCIIEEGVSIDKNTILISHVVLKGNVTIGQDNIIYSFVTIGEVNQDLKYQGEPTKVVIGNRNSIRESCTIHRGTVQGTGVTVIGDDNLLMVNTHVAHDCIIGNHNILANNATLGGHVVLDNYVVIGGCSALHQFVNVGSHVMVGGCSAVVQDVPPYVLVQGNHAVAIGLNTLGLSRRGFDRKNLSMIKKAYIRIYNEGKTIPQAIDSLKELAEQDKSIDLFIEFLSRASCKRGIVRPRVK